jgi:hypothetical protein
MLLLFFFLSPEVLFGDCNSEAGIEIIGTPAFNLGDSFGIFSLSSSANERFFVEGDELLISVSVVVTFGEASITCSSAVILINSV